MFGLDPYHIAYQWTERQYLTALYWLQEQWNRPRRGDWYMMAVAAEVRRSNSKRPKSVKIEHLKLKFEDSKNQQGSDNPLGMTPEEQKLALVKAAAFARVGGRIRNKPRPEDLVKRRE